MSYVRVNGTTHVHQNSGSAGTGFTITYSPTAGNLVTIHCGNGVASGDPLPTSVKDNLNNALTIVSAPLSADNQRAWCAYYIAPSGVTSFTAAGSAASTFATYNLVEWSGNAASSPLDQSHAATGASPLNTGSITNTNANNLNIAIGVCDDNSTTAWNNTANSAWTVEFNDGDSATGTPANVLYLIASGSTGPFSATMNYPPATANVASLILSFLPAGSGPSENLTEQTATFSEGTVARAVTYALTAQTASFTEGIISASTGGNVTLSLTGQTATFSEGALTHSLAYLLDDGVGLGGQVATFSEGTPTESISYALTGQSITSSEGAPTHAVTVALTGQTATFTEGTITASAGGNVTTSLTGQTATFTEGTITAQFTGDVTRSLTALQAVFAQGTIAVTIPGGVIVPDVVGLPWLMASQRLIEQNLTQTQAPIRTALLNAPPGVVTAQSPPAGTFVSVGTDVTLTVVNGYLLGAANFGVIPWWVT